MKNLMKICFILVPKLDSKYKQSVFHETCKVSRSLSILPDDFTSGSKSKLGKIKPDK